VGPGFPPIDRRLGLRAQMPFTPGLIESAVLLGVSLPFAQAAAILAHFTGVRMHQDTTQRWTEAAGHAAATPVSGDVASLYATSPASPPGPPVQQLSIDGAMVSLVHGNWAEVKTLAIGTVTTGPDGAPHATDLSYCTRLADAEAFGEIATRETHRRGTRRAGTVVAVTDGPAWIQPFVDGQRLDAVRILDFPRAVKQLATAAKAVFGAGTLAASDGLGTHSAHRAPDRGSVCLSHTPPRAEAGAITIGREDKYGEGITPYRFHVPRPRRATVRTAAR